MLEYPQQTLTPKCKILMDRKCPEKLNMKQKLPHLQKLPNNNPHHQVPTNVLIVI
jgi:hypothetical protein